MCHGCATEYADTELPSNYEEVSAAVTAIYEHTDGGTGGPLHIVVDDFNVDSVQWCLDHMDDHVGKIPDWPDDLKDLARKAGMLLLPLTEQQRGAVISYVHGYR